MRWLISVSLSIVLHIASASQVMAQGPERLRGEAAYPTTVPENLPEKNPLAGDPEAIRMGMGFFRVRCADCHGIDAKGMRGPDLSQIWSSGRTDSSVFKTVRTGVPGSEMPPAFRLMDDDLWRVLAYLRTLATTAPNEPPRGNAANGEKLFQGICTSCHRVGGQGGKLGPDLSRVGSGRSRAFMTRRIRGTVDESRPGYEPVVLTLMNGQVIRGVKKKEDMFSVQIMDTNERIQGYLKADLRSVESPKSIMPAFSFNDSDLDDILAYLVTLRGTATPSAATHAAGAGRTTDENRPPGDGDK
jgi:putative heme-binding domain-containing protein